MRFRGVALALCSAALLYAVDASLRISQYQKSYWAVEQGLPHNYVTAIAQAQDGLLWIGTDEGLARFDGLSFRQAAASPALRLDHSWISALLRARDGSLWTGTFEGNLLRFGNGTKEEAYPVGGSIFALLEDAEGGIWASSRNGVFRVAGGRVERLAGLSSPLDTSWNVLSGDARGNTWIVDSGGLKHYRQGAVRTVLTNGGVHGDILTVLARRQGPDVWLGTSTGVYRLTDEAHAHATLVEGAHGPVVSLLEDRDGTLWAGTWGHGVYRLASGHTERWSGQDGLPDDFIRTLAEDNEGNVWIGMRSGGLGRWKEPRIVAWGSAEGLAGNYATVVAGDRAGGLWLGTWRGGLYRRAGERLEPQATPMPVPYFTVRALAFDPQGHPWIGNWEGLFGFDGRKYEHFAVEPDSAFRRVSVLHFDRAGGLWVGTTDRGLFRFPNGRPDGEAHQGFLESAQITALLEDSGGRMWAGTNRGLWRVPVSPGGTAERETALGDESVQSLFQDSHRRIWVSTSGGALFVLEKDRLPIRLDRRNGLPPHALYRVLEDDTGTFWVSSPRGILELSRAVLEEVLAARRTGLDIVVYGQEDGMRTIECHGLSQPAGWKARDGSLWLPTTRGFVQVRRARPHAVAPPHVRIEEPGSPVTLEAGARNLEVQFTAPRLTSPHRVEFRYRMEGFDPGWVNAGSERSARYNEVPPGVHLFHVQARDPAGEWGDEAVLSVMQKPRFHQSWWFVLLLALASAAVVTAGYRWRLHTIRSRYAAVLEERNRIGREWHDTLVAGFSAISLQLEAAMARLKDQPDRSSEILDVTRKMVHHYRAEARRVIWDLRDNRPEGETIEVAVENALHRLTETRGIEGTVQVTGVAVELPIELQHNVVRICQEAMANAARHGAPGRIDIRLDFAPAEETLNVTIEDDGKGFDYPAAVSEATGHFGLVVMQERARRHGGHLEVTSQPGSGTRVAAVIPIPAGPRR